MEERKKLLDYLAQAILIFGITILIIAIICILVGDEAKGYSTMFEFGSAGIPMNTVLQYLLSSVCITVIRFMFFTDTFIKRMSVAARTIAMLISVIILVGVFAHIFGWFPVDEPRCWIYFFICFGICFMIGAITSITKEKSDNKQLAEGLKNLKEVKEVQNVNSDRSK